MKKKIALLFAGTFVLFLLVSAYSIFSVQKTTSELDTLVQLHEVELLREDLLTKIREVQEALKLKGTPYAQGVDSMATDVVAMSSALDKCFGCHHSPAVNEQLDVLKISIRRYQDSLSRTLTVQADPASMAEDEAAAYQDGEDLTRKVVDIITAAHIKLQARTNLALSKISRTKYTLFAIAGMGPLLAIGLGYLIMGKMAAQFNAVLSGIRRLKGGDLSYRIASLQDEFGEMAESFNEMASSLAASIRKTAESEQHYRTIFERAGEAIFILSSDERTPLMIIDANQAAADMHGYTVGEMRSMHITDFGQPEITQQVTVLLDRIMKGEWIKFETKHKRKDGSVFPVEVSAGPITIGDKTYILNFNSDITERKKTEKSLQESRQFKVGGELAAGLTHELKNSLGGIKIAIEVLLEETALSAEDRKVLMDILKEMQRIETITRDLLDYARPPSPQFVAADLNAVVDRTFAEGIEDIRRELSDARRISIERDYDRQLPKTLADPSQIRQIFLNILRNAVDAMPDGGVITVKTVYKPEDRVIEVLVSDTGKGVSASERAMIFEPFFTTKPKGSGLGLPIVRRLVEQQGGKILLADEGGTGTVFRVIFPVRDTGEVSRT